MIAGLAALPATALAQRLTPAVQRIEPTPVAPGSMEARIVAKLPRYVPQEQVSGTISLWGHGNAKLPWMRHLVGLWETGFKAFHPSISTDYQMHGTSSGVPALFTGAGDVAILGEEILPEAVRAFTRFKGYAPTGVEICTGSLDVRNFDYAQQIFVHRDNPLAWISLAELDGILGQEHRRGGANLRRWGELGLGGEWAQRAITPYCWAIDDSFGMFLEEFVLEGSHRWNGALREFVHITYPDGSIYDHGQQILDALAQDPSGIAVSNIRYSVPQVKPLALGRTGKGPFVQASKASLIDGSYPLARYIPAIVDREPGQAMAPKVREFLRYLVSREGQQAVIADGRYLPLSPERAAQQRKAIA